MADTPGSSRNGSPLALLDAISKVVIDIGRGMPIARDAIRLAEQAEGAAIAALRSRLGITGTPLQAIGGGAANGSTAAALSPAKAFADLLERAEVQTPRAAREDAAMWLVRQLSPDEARMIAALADGSEHPVIHVAVTQGISGSAERVLANLTSLGRTARVRVRELSPRYLQHLLDLGLAELGPESAGRSTDYEVLEADTSVRHALEPYEGKLMSKARIVRESVRLSELGRAFWDACDPATEHP